MSYCLAKPRPGAAESGKMRVTRVGAGGCPPSRLLPASAVIPEIHLSPPLPALRKQGWEKPWITFVTKGYLRDSCAFPKVPSQHRVRTGGDRSPHCSRRNAAIEGFTPPAAQTSPCPPCQKWRWLRGRGSFLPKLTLPVRKEIFWSLIVSSASSNLW